MKKVLNFSFIILIILSAVVSINACQKKPPSSSSSRPFSLFIFGDSFFDPGNNNYINTSTLDQANFSPYGQTYFKFPTGRFSDGRLISDFIAEYAKLPKIAPFLQPGNNQFSNGANFASAGAGALVQTFQGEVIDLKTQLKNYKKVEARLRNKIGNVETKKTISGAVFLFSIGTNDYMSPFLTNSTMLLSFSNSQYVDMVINSLTMVVKEIYDKGGRKFGFLNLGDLGCLPGMRLLRLPDEKGCFDEASELAKLHNHELQRILSKMKKQLPGFRYSLFDFYHSLRQRMNHPTKYGFKEGKAACCGTGPFRGIFSCGGTRPPVKEYELCQNPNEYVFWDSYHLTEKIYKQMADQMWGEATKGTYDIKSLFQCS